MRTLASTHKLRPDKTGLITHDRKSNFMTQIQSYVDFNITLSL